MPKIPVLTPDSSEFLSGGGEVGALMRCKDWSQNPMGPISSWPASLKTSISICLSSRFPICIFWGKDHVQLYNDSYRPMMGAEKHPVGLGRRGCDTWPEIWALIKPMLDGVLETGEATWAEDQLFMLERDGYLEEAYFTFSYSPIRVEGGGAGGVFCAVTETTNRVLSERRMRTLSDIAARAAQVRTPAEAYLCLARSTIHFNPDLPFTCFYELDPGTQVATIRAGSGYPGPLPGFSSSLSLHAAKVASDHAESSERLVAPFVRVLKTGQPERLENPEGIWDGFLTDPALQIRSALILPLGALEKKGVTGFLVMGLNPHRHLDGNYRDFLNLVAGHFTTALQNAQAYETERLRTEALTELDRSKTEFFSNISHEFRTPLTLIIGLAEEMATQGSDGLSPENLEKVIALRRNGSRLLKLVNNLLDYSRIEAGRMEACYQQTDLPALTRDVASTFRSALERVNLSLIMDCPVLDEAVYVDKDMWEKVILNLLSNAFKYTLTGEISVSLHAREGSAELQVKDTGIGISPEELPHIFERFHRVHGATGRAKEGSGIGLALVRQLVLLHGGTLEAESQVGQGTTITLRIPLGKDHLPPEHVRSEREADPLDTATPTVPLEAGSWKPEWREVEEKREVSEADITTPFTETSQPGSTAHILLVDDNADMRNYVKRLLEKHWHVETAEDGISALAAFQNHPPDLVLSDVMMSGMDGFELFRALRANPEARNVPIILLSARAGDESISKGLDQGADDYLIKPFSSRELVARIKAHLKLAAARKETEKLLLEALADTERERSHLYALFMEAPAMIAIFKGPDQVFDFANPLYQQAIGYQDVIGKTLLQALPELKDTGILEILDNVYTKGEIFRSAELLIPSKIDGRMQDDYFTFTYQPMRGRANVIEGVMVFAYNVTTQVVARKKAEEASFRLEAQKRILEMVAQGRPLRETLEILAQSIQEKSEGVRASILLMEADGLRLRHGAAPELPDRFNLAMDGMIVGPEANWCGVSAFTREKVWVADLAADPLWKDFRDLAIDIGIKACYVHPILASDGKVLGTFTVYYPEIKDPTSLETHYIDVLTRTAAIAIDRKQAEDTLRQTQEQLAHSQKMDAVGKLAGGIAHEFNNLLTAINGYTDLLLVSPMEWEMQCSYLREVKRAGGRAAVLTSQILAFGRKQMLSPNLLAMDEVVRGMQNMVRQLIGEDIEFQVSVAPDLGNIFADKGQIEQVILNLIINARDAMPSGGRLSLGLTDIYLDEEVIPSVHASPGAYVLLTVSDTGTGMDKSTQARIFEPFFTTKGVGKGTGLGLSMAEGIIRQSGGHIEVISALGKGSIFRVYLPKAKPSEAPVKIPGTNSVPVLSRGDAVILVVEDEDAVLTLVSRILKAQGYIVWEACSAEEAMAWHAMHSEEHVHLLLTDVVMPGGSGLELAEKLQALRPEMQVLYMSGYTEDLILRHGVHEDSVTFIGKPFSPSALLHRVQDILKAVFVSGSHSKMKSSQN